MAAFRIASPECVFVRVPKTGSSETSHYSRYFDQPTREYAEAVYADDLNASGYRFGPA